MNPRTRARKEKKGSPVVGYENAMQLVDGKVKPLTCPGIKKAQQSLDY